MTDFLIGLGLGLSCSIVVFVERSVIIATLKTQLKNLENKL